MHSGPTIAVKFSNVPEPECGNFSELTIKKYSAEMFLFIITKATVRYNR